MSDRALLAARLAGVAVLALAAVLVLVLVGTPDQQQVRSAFSGSGWAGAGAFAALYAAVSLSPLPKPVFSLAAGALFGVVWGVAIVLVGATAGATMAFWLGRILGREVVRRRSGARAHRLDDRLRDNGVWAVIVLRLAPVVPFTSVNYLFGVTSLRPGAFLVGTVVGMLPGTAAYVTLGAYGSQPESWPFIVGLAGLLLLTVVALVIHRRQRQSSPGDVDCAESGSSA